MSAGGSQTKKMRCAIYTRVSSDAGLEQDFNSLDAQREAAEAYIKSQAHEGWRLLKGQYNDGGFSGGTMERPGLQSLLDDIKAGQIDIVVVYKVDRLTRSLADFAKLVELFDQYGVSFVSVTQAFNTTTSMGRLTLNVLLSFAQFEREVTGERIRDKIAASKKKGIWMGGVIPYGYRLDERKLLIDEQEAEHVRLIFRSYLELKSLPKLQQFLKDKGIRSRVRKMSDGRTIGGIPLSNGPLSFILRNRLYLGEINHRKQSYPGEHAAIIDPDLFDRVQVILNTNQAHSRERYANSNMMLKGKVYDDKGNRMSPNFAVKRGIRYRYYVSQVLAQGDKVSAGSAPRVAAMQVENLVRQAIIGQFPGKLLLSSDPNQTLDQPITALIEKVTISADTIEIRTTRDIPATNTSSSRAKRKAKADYKISNKASSAPIATGAAAADDKQSIIDPRTIRIAWSGPNTHPRKDILLPASSNPEQLIPMPAQHRAKLILAIARSRRWLHQITSGTTTIEKIAKHERFSVKHVRTNLTLAFLDPAVIKAAIAGHLPKGYGITRLTNLPADWSEQRKLLGL